MQNEHMIAGQPPALSPDASDRTSREGLPLFAAGAGMSGPGNSATPGVSLSGTMLPDSVLKIPVVIQVIIGSARLALSQVTQLSPGALVLLDQKLGEPASILVNGREVARGELVILDDENGRLGVTITQVSDARGQISL